MQDVMGEDAFGEATEVEPKISSQQSDPLRGKIGEVRPEDNLTKAMLWKAQVVHVHGVGECMGVAAKWGCGSR